MLQEAITSPYVDYNYYSETYGGNKIPQDSFDACENVPRLFYIESLLTGLSGSLKSRTW